MHPVIVNRSPPDLRNRDSWQRADVYSLSERSSSVLRARTTASALESFRTFCCCFAASLKSATFHEIKLTLDFYNFSIKTPQGWHSRKEIKCSGIKKKRNVSPEKQAYEFHFPVTNHWRILKLRQKILQELVSYRGKQVTSRTRFFTQYVPTGLSFKPFRDKSEPSASPCCLWRTLRRRVGSSPRSKWSRGPPLHSFPRRFRSVGGCLERTPVITKTIGRLTRATWRGGSFVRQQSLNLSWIIMENIVVNASCSRRLSRTIWRFLSIIWKTVLLCQETSVKCNFKTNLSCGARKTKYVRRYRERGG